VDKETRENLYVGALCVLVVAWVGFAAWIVLETRRRDRALAEHQRMLVEAAHLRKWEDEI